MRTKTQSKQRWDRYQKCRLFTEHSDYALNFDLDFKDYEMIASVLETFELDKSEIIGVEITKCKFKITLPGLD